MITLNTLNTTELEKALLTVETTLVAALKAVSPAIAVNEFMDEVVLSRANLECVQDRLEMQVYGEELKKNYAEILTLVNEVLNKGGYGSDPELHKICNDGDTVLRKVILVQDIIGTLYEAL